MKWDKGLKHKGWHYIPGVNAGRLVKWNISKCSMTRLSCAKGMCTQWQVPLTQRILREAVFLGQIHLAWFSVVAQITHLNSYHLPSGFVEQHCIRYADFSSLFFPSPFSPSSLLSPHFPVWKNNGEVWHEWGSKLDKHRWEEEIKVRCGEKNIKRKNTKGVSQKNRKGKGGRSSKWIRVLKFLCVPAPYSTTHNTQVLYSPRCITWGLVV